MRTSKTMHYKRDDTNVAGVGSAFNAAKRNELVLTSGSFLGRLNGIVIGVSSMSAGPAPTTLTMRITEDAAGDRCIVTDTDSSISVGLTTATSGTADYRADIDLSVLGGTVYVFCKTNTGTCTIDSVTITWEI